MVCAMDADEQRTIAEYARRARTVAADRYALWQPAAWFSYRTQRQDAFVLLRRHGMLPLTGRDVLEVGCGSADWLADLPAWGAEPDRLHGIDLIEERVQHARDRLPGADIRVGSARALPWSAQAFDLVIQSTVFSSILDLDLRLAAAREMLRVLRPAGTILWYDLAYDNPRNPAVAGIGRRALANLFPDCRIDARRVTLAPPIARRLVPAARPVAQALQAARVFNSHLMAVITR